MSQRFPDISVDEWAVLARFVDLRSPLSSGDKAVVDALWKRLQPDASKRTTASKLRKFHTIIEYDSYAPDELSAIEELARVLPPDHYYTQAVLASRLTCSSSSPGAFAAAVRADLWNKEYFLKASLDRKFLMMICCLGGAKPEKATWVH